jgi:DNA relaxase NicK
VSDTLSNPTKLLTGANVIHSAGVDWLTCTAIRCAEDKPLYELALSLIEGEKDAGNDVRKFSLAGYHGYGAGGARYGVRDDSIILQLSGETARLHWREAHALARNVSRLDAQLTVQLAYTQPEIIKTLHSDAMSHRSRGGRPSNRTLITSTVSGDTLYLGQRVSDSYLRAYDKGIEQRSCDAGVLLRYESESKRLRAVEDARQLSCAEDEATSAAALVCSRFMRQGVRVPASCSQWQWNSLFLPLSDNDRKLRWLRSSVLPTVAHLTKAVGRSAILEALGLNDESETTGNTEGE